MIKKPLKTVKKGINMEVQNCEKRKFPNCAKPHNMTESQKNEMRAKVDVEVINVLKLNMPMHAKGIVTVIIAKINANMSWIEKKTTVKGPNPAFPWRTFESHIFKTGSSI